MANESRQLYQAFIKKGMPKEDAFFAVLDHFNDQHWEDRNRYHDRIKNLETDNAELKAKLADLVPNSESV
jgi:hypothetical protein